MPDPWDHSKRIFWEGERTLKFEKDPNTGEDRWVSYTAKADPETGEITLVPDGEA